MPRWRLGTPNNGVLYPGTWRQSIAGIYCGRRDPVAHQSGFGDGGREWLALLDSTGYRAGQSFAGFPGKRVALILEKCFSPALLFD